uniref:P/Homo B domain-containing protein n=1 Tax=Heterorhabditis bacteriophora TaxID=37862 RepID=A0A1I7WEN4_HETBA
MLGESQIVNDAIEGDALAYALEHVDIYSVSWGPRDDGRSVERPQELAAKALERGAKMCLGRNGLGSLYVWASGNGGLQDDDCAMDGYASNKYTLTFGIASSEGISPWYAEGCPAIMASVNEGTRKISGMVTTDVGNRCTTFAGSSAAAPLAASILALTLEANPQLSQRDVQHLIVRTADPTSLMNSSARGWKTNGAGLHYSRFFGFGTMNALKMVQVAQKWTSVEGERTCSKDIVLQNGTFSSLSPLTTQISFEGCQGTYGEVNFVERVELAVSVTHGRRGAVHIYLTSPMGLCRSSVVLYPHVTCHFYSFLSVAFA